MVEVLIWNMTLSQSHIMTLSHIMRKSLHILDMTGNGTTFMHSNNPTL